MRVRFKNWNCYLNKRLYNSNGIALTLADEIDGHTVAVCTVNVPDLPLEADEVVIKDYSENEGMLYALVSAGVVSEPIGYHQQGYVEMPICKVLRTH